ncbi:MAG TPA: hypothetical protein VK449_02950 [Anaerolineales bacterium]|nr:hypothetical protein [Anaerolineales bacterium]
MTGLWVLLTLVAPPAAREMWRRLAPRLQAWESEIAFWAQAAYGVLPLYLAWVTGAVIGWDCGLSGMSPADWLRGAVVIFVLLAAWSAALRLPQVRRAASTWYGHNGSWTVLFDEPRWTFYRGAAAMMFLHPVGAQVVGWVLGVVEWVARGGRPARRTPPHVWAGLVRLTVSAGLFALVHNLWLILMAQAAAQALLLRQKPGAPSA